MTIPKAIEIQQELLHHIDYPLIQDDSDAIKLGIEALKAYQRIRAVELISPDKLLPGETKD